MDTGRTPDAWMRMARDPEGGELDAAVAQLVELLSGVRRAATGVAGEAPLGLRLVDLADGRPRVICAFPGPRFLCVDVHGVPEGSVRAVVRHASGGLLWEHVEVSVDAARLDELATAGGALLAQEPDPEVAPAVQETVQAALALRRWREAPLRAVASLAQVDVAVALHDTLHRAFGRFVSASEPLVERQDTLSPQLVAALAAFERAAGAVSAHTRLAEGIAAVLPACDEGAAEMAAAHITPLE